mmetsp:Transcript_19989/g.43329  ORF Transcript_19989/g.43329 Transcript_19989/m.43329 type:complete len:187 (-) Transcript_19989:617-1177(-)
MSLTALAIVSRQGSPLYLRDYSKDCNLIFGLDGQFGDGDSDIFGDDNIIPVKEMTPEQEDEWPCQLKHQFILHSACQRLDDVLRDNQWKTPGAVGMDACWVGFLCSSDNLRAYGYVTTNVRYVALVEDAMELQLQKSRESELCVLMSNVHRFYTESLLNPFSSPHSKITSKRFDSSATSLITNFNG